MKNSVTTSNPRTVSEKFYAGIESQALDALRSLGGDATDKLGPMMAIIDAYIADGIVPDSGSCWYELLIFNLLQPELDKAKARSARARSRRRQPSDESGESAVETREPAAKTPAPSESAREPEQADGEAIAESPAPDAEAHKKQTDSRSARPEKSRRRARFHTRKLTKVWTGRAAGRSVG